MARRKINDVRVFKETLQALDVIDTEGATELRRSLERSRWSRDDTSASVNMLAREYGGERGLEILAEAADRGDNKTTARLCRLIADRIDGKEIGGRKSRSVDEAQEILSDYLRSSPRGWVFDVPRNGYARAFAVADVNVSEDDEGTKYLNLHLRYNGGSTSFGSKDRNYLSRRSSIRASEARGKTGEALLDLLGFFIADADLIEDYDQQTEYQDSIVSELSTHQFVFDGVVDQETESLFLQDDPDNRHNDRLRRTQSINRAGAETVRQAILCDNEESLSSGKKDSTSSLIWMTNEDDEPKTIAMPSHHIVKVFDTGSLTYLYVHSNSLTEYEYDEKITDRIVLPESHRDLLDVLTSDLDTINDDIIVGKGGGTMILCKGAPGLGKTLTAEAYSEITHRPLLAIHSGIMGTKPSIVRENLRIAFDLARKFDAILLLDEADVFILKRRESLIQNSIVAEFLRVLEYFDGLLFMTTNRSEDIDDAIESRSAAIVHYSSPHEEELRRVWNVFADLFDAPLSKKFVNDLIKAFPDISPRSVKMLFRLTLRFSRSRKEELSLDHFKRMAVFRGIDF